MTPEVISIIVLALMFLIGTVRSVNMGILGFVGAFGVGLLLVGMTNKEIAAGFPVDLFLALVGLTLLFGFAQLNGSIDLLVQWCLRAVRGKIALAPWIFFIVSGVLMSIGAIFAIACVAPLAIPFARRYKINQLMMGMMVVHGGMAGAFSPVSVYGVFLNGFLSKQGLPGNPLFLFLASFIFNTVVALVVYLTLGGPRLRTSGAPRDNESVGPVSGPSASASSAGTSGGGPAGGVILETRPSAPALAPGATGATGSRATPYQVLTLAGLLVLGIGTAGFSLDIGVLSLGIATVLAIVNPNQAKTAMAKVSWGTVVLVCGVITYIYVLQKAGAVELVSSGIAALGIPIIAVLLLCYMAGIVSALASSLGTIGVAVAIAAPGMASGEVSALGVAAALAISATVVDVSPFSTNGALVLANVDEENREKYFRQMLVYSGIVTAVAPALAWLAIFIPI